MKEFNCIVCPNSCLLKAEERDGRIRVSGNKCPNGERFAISEMTQPMRTVCSTVKTAFPDVPVLPVKVSREIPKDRIFDVMIEIDKIVLKERVRRGEVIIADVLGLGADVISTSDVLNK